MGVCCSQCVTKTPLKGYKELPGYAHLPEWSDLLYVGNQYSAASEHFDTVISTCYPLDLNGKKNPRLSSHALYFEDSLGDESGEALILARARIIKGATLVAHSIAANLRTLVHCQWGQNRSGSIVCAYAVLHLGWTAQAAIDYMRKQNFKDRSYIGQSPMSNPAFCEIIHDLEREYNKITFTVESKGETMHQSNQHCGYSVRQAQAAPAYSLHSQQSSPTLLVTRPVYQLSSLKLSTNLPCQFAPAPSTLTPRTSAATLPGCATSHAFNIRTVSCSIGVPTTVRSIIQHRATRSADMPSPRSVHRSVIQNT